MKDPIQIMIDDFEFVMVDGNAPGRPTPRHAQLVKEAREQLKATTDLLGELYDFVCAECQWRGADTPEEVKALADRAEAALRTLGRDV